MENDVARSEPLSFEHMKLFKIVTLIVVSCLACVSHAAGPKRTVVPISELKEGTPEYIAVKFYQALQAGDLTEAGKYASKSLMAEFEWKLSGPNRQEGVVQNLKAVVFTEVSLCEAKNEVDGDRLVLSFLLRKKAEDGSLGWGVYNPRFMRISGNWLMVTYAEHARNQLSK